MLKRPSLARLSLSARLTLGFTLSTVAVVLAGTAFLYWSLVEALTDRDETFMYSINEAMTSMMSRDDKGELMRFRVFEEWPKRTSEIFYVRLFDDRQVIMAQSPNSAEVFDYYPLKINPAQTERFLVQPFRLKDQVYHAYLFPVSVKGTRYWGQLALNRTQANAVLTDFRFRLFAALALSTLICALICFQVVRRALKPLHNMAQTAARINSSNLNERILPADLPYELAHLAETFDGMLDRLQASFDRLQRFSADISHELRTPISNISGELQVALGKDRPMEFYKEAIGSALEECARLSRIIDSLLFLAQADNPKMTLGKELINLRKELEMVMEFYEPAAQESGVTLDLDVTEDIPVLVERTLFQRAMGNLISNALKKTPPNGRIVLSALRRGRNVEVGVKDTGEGIAREHLPYLFDRFYRVDASRSKDLGGSGLGLAIVKSIASIHGGDVHIDSEPGVGTHVTITLPTPSVQISPPLPNITKL